MGITLERLLEGYIHNFHRWGLYIDSNVATLTQRELGHFADLGLLLGYFVFYEHGRRDASNRSRPMDLSWWAWDPHSDEYTRLVLHLERENLPTKASETLDKLFAGGDVLPELMAGIVYVADEQQREQLIAEVQGRRDEARGLLLICRRRKTVIEETRGLVEHLDAYIWPAGHRRYRHRAAELRPDPDGRYKASWLVE